MAGLGAWACDPRARRRVLTAASIPGAMLVALYAKNAVLFGAFAVSTFGPASYTLVTVARLPAEVRDAWMAQGALSPFAAVSVYAPPREYARFFDTPDHADWPPQLTRLEQPTVTAANFNHWWLLDVHRARMADVRHYLRTRPFDYPATVLASLQEMFGPTTTWHPRDRTAGSPRRSREATKAPHEAHRQVLGRYEDWFNRLVHGVPFAPVGLYLFLPVPLLWASARAWSQVRAPEPGRAGPRGVAVPAADADCLRRPRQHDADRPGGSAVSLSDRMDDLGGRRRVRGEPIQARQASAPPSLAGRLTRPARVDRLGRIGGDLQIGAVVIRVATRLVVDVIGHELNHLQRALGAGDVRQLDVGLPRRHRRLQSLRRRLARLVVVLEQAVGEHRDCGGLWMRPHTE